MLYSYGRYYIFQKNHQLYRIVQQLYRAVQELYRIVQRLQEKYGQKTRLYTSCIKKTTIVATIQ